VVLCGVCDDECAAAEQNCFLRDRERRDKRDWIHYLGGESGECVVQGESVVA